MIKQQVLHNFQAHTNSTLNYHPGVNVIIGSGDAGKSCLWRALQWVKANRPLSNGFIHDDMDDCFVRLILKDADGETIIERGRNRKDNGYYKLNDDELTSFGVNPPEVITQALVMEDINFQEQKEPYFLVVKSPGETARYIRELMGLNIIDEATSNLATRIKRSNGIINSLECDQAENEQALLAMEELQLDHFQVLLVQTQSYKKQQSIAASKLQQLEFKMSEYNQVQEQLDAIPDNIEATIRLAEEQTDKYLQINLITGFFQQRVADYDECVKDFVITTDFVQKMYVAEELAVKYMHQAQHTQRFQLPIDAYDECIKQFVVDVKVLTQKMNIAKDHIQMINELFELIGLINPLIEKWNTTINNTIDAKEITALISLAEQQADEYNTLKQKKCLMSQVHSEGFNKQTQLAVLEKTKQKYQNDVDVFTAQLVDCPTCGHKLTDKEKDQLIEGSKNG